MKANVKKKKPMKLKKVEELTKEKIMELYNDDKGKLMRLTSPDTLEQFNTTGQAFLAIKQIGDIKRQLVADEAYDRIFSLMRSITDEKIAGLSAEKSADVIVKIVVAVNEFIKGGMTVSDNLNVPTGKSILGNMTESEMKTKQAELMGRISKIIDITPYRKNNNNNGNKK